MSEVVQLQLEPIQVADFRESLEPLEARFANFWAAASFPMRLISRTRRCSFAPLRADLQRRAEALEPARDRHDAERLWRWRWLRNYRRMYETIEAVDPPLAVDHWLLCWPDRSTTPDALRSVVRSTFLLPAVEPRPLPPLISGPYREEAHYLQPLEPGYPYLTVLTAWDVRGSWDLLSWQPLLLSDYELALAIDVHTLRRDQAVRRCTDAFVLLTDAVYGRHAVKDARSERALAAVNHSLSRLDTEALHEVAYAVLLQAPTLEQLEAQAQALRALLGVRLQLERVRGAQAEYARIFTSQPATAIGAPLIRRNTLSQGVAAKMPIGVRKSARTAGITWGYDRDEAMPVQFDLWGASGHENGHLLMVGKSGSGKTVALQTLALRQAVAGTQVIFFDPVGKSRRLCEAAGAGARYYDLATDAAINILDRVSDDAGEQRAAVQRKLSIVLGRVQTHGGRTAITPRELSNFEVGALDLALMPLYATSSPRQELVLGDLVTRLRAIAHDRGLPARATRAAEELASEIELVLLGSRARIFGGATTLRWDWTADVTGYNFRAADPALLPLYYDHAFEALNRYVRTRPAEAPPVIAIIDEFFYMSSVRALEAHVALATTTWRNFRAAMWTATQNAVTYFGQEGLPAQWGPFTVNNALIKLFFRQEGSEAEVIGRAYRDQLAPEHLQAMKTAAPAECVALFGDEVHRLVIQLTDLEQTFFLE